MKIFQVRTNPNRYQSFYPTGDIDPDDFASSSDLDDTGSSWPIDHPYISALVATLVVEDERLLPADFYQSGSNAFVTSPRDKITARTLGSERLDKTLRISG